MHEGGALARLREETDGVHRALDARLDVVAALSCPARRPMLVARYRRFHEAAAAMLAGWRLDGHHSWLDREAGATGPDREEHGSGRWPERFAPADGAEALGFRYAVEGSALGGRVILRELERNGVDTAGLGFLDPLGSGAGPAWRALAARIERGLPDEGSWMAAVAGARKGFGFAEAVLCGGAGEPAAARMAEQVA